jgi:hypothetical protein
MFLLNYGMFIHLREEEIRNVRWKHLQGTSALPDFIISPEQEETMNKMVACPHQGCRAGKVHYFVDFEIIWDDCPICDGLGSVQRYIPDRGTEYHSRK